MEDYFNKQATGTTFRAISAEIVKTSLFPLPPFAEQQRIVTKVDELMGLCDGLEIAEKELETLEYHFAEYLPKSILQVAVRGKLVPQNATDEPATKLLKCIQQEKTRLIKDGKIKKEKPLSPIIEDKIPYDLPDGWVWCRLGNFIKIIAGMSYKKDFVQTSGVRILRGGNIQSLEIKLFEDDVFLPIERSYRIVR